MGRRGPHARPTDPLAHQRPLRHGVVKIDYDTLLRTTLEYARGQPTIAGDRVLTGVDVVIGQYAALPAASRQQPTSFFPE